MPTFGWVEIAVPVPPENSGPVGGVLTTPPAGIFREISRAVRGFLAMLSVLPCTWAAVTDRGGAGVGSSAKAAVLTSKSRPQTSVVVATSSVIGRQRRTGMPPIRLFVTSSDRLAGRSGAPGAGRKSTGRSTVGSLGRAYRRRWRTMLAGWDPDAAVWLNPSRNQAAHGCTTGAFGSVRVGVALEGQETGQRGVVVVDMPGGDRCVRHGQRGCRGRQLGGGRTHT